MAGHLVSGLTSGPFRMPLRVLLHEAEHRRRRRLSSGLAGPDSDQQHHRESKLPFVAREPTPDHTSETSRIHSEQKHGIPPNSSKHQQPGILPGPSIHGKNVLKSNESTSPSLFASAFPHPTPYGFPSPDKHRCRCPKSDESESPSKSKSKRDRTRTVHTSVSAPCEFVA